MYRSQLPPRPWFGCTPAAAQGGSATGQWVKRTPVKPDPSKVVVPPGYKVGVFKAGLDTPASATVDKDGNLWVTISGVLLGSPEADQFEPPHVKIFDKDGKLLREVGKGLFKTVMNEIGFCAENGKTYIPEYGEKIWEMDGVNAEPKLIIKDLLNRRPPQRRHHLQGRVYLFCAGLSEQQPALPIPTIMDGPTSRTIRSG